MSLSKVVVNMLAVVCKFNIAYIKNNVSLSHSLSLSLSLSLCVFVSYRGTHTVQPIAMKLSQVVVNMPGVVLEI